LAVLVTGGAGFIGSHLVEELIKKDQTVIVVDNLSTGKIENLPCSDKVIFIEGDISEKGFVKELFSFYSFDKVFHLAAVASVAKSVELPEETHRTNFDATLYLLESSIGKVNRFVFASSAAVYGDLLELPKREDMPVKPLTPYAVDKYASERYVVNAFRLYGLDSTAVRFFNVFGERQDPSSPYSGVISIFIDRIKRYKNGEDTEIVIYGDGKQTRDFIYVKDVVKALILLSESRDSSGEVFNLGTGSSISLLEILDILKEIVGDLPPVRFEKERKGDIKHSQADISKIKSLGFSPEYSLKEGLEKLLFSEGVKT